MEIESPPVELLLHQLQSCLAVPLIIFSNKRGSQRREALCTGRRNKEADLNDPIPVHVLAVQRIVLNGQAVLAQRAVRFRSQGLQHKILAVCQRRMLIII
ncbi:hypothetical protein D3C73_931830 [compost metagenome]